MAFAQLVATEDMRHDARRIDVVAPYAVSFWHIEGDDDMQTMEMLTMNALARLEANDLKLPILTRVIEGMGLGIIDAGIASTGTTAQQHQQLPAYE